MFALCSLEVLAAEWALLFALGLGFSNGSLTTTSFVYASECAGVGHAELAGNVMVLSLMFGLMLGAFAGWLWLL